MIKIYIAKIPTKINKHKIPLNLLQEISKYKHSQARLQKNASYLLLIHILKLHRVDNQKILTNKYGKPFLANLKIHFNLSHGGKYVVCAVSSAPVGVDIEPINHNIKKISSAFLTKKECQTYCLSSNQELTQVWTLKEAIVKLMGIGLAKRLNTISLDEPIIVQKKHIYTYTCACHIYDDIQLALASYNPLPKRINLKHIQLT